MSWFINTQHLNHDAYVPKSYFLKYVLNKKMVNTFIPHRIADVTTYPCWFWIQSVLIKRVRVINLIKVIHICDQQPLCRESDTSRLRKCQVRNNTIYTHDITVSPWNPIRSPITSVRKPSLTNESRQYAVNTRICLMNRCWWYCIAAHA